MTISYHDYDKMSTFCRIIFEKFSKKNRPDAFGTVFCFYVLFRKRTDERALLGGRRIKVARIFGRDGKIAYERSEERRVGKECRV